MHKQFMAEEGRQNIIKAVADYSKHLFRFIRGRVRTEEDAEDILQEVWYQLSNTGEAIEQVGAWLYRVARNKIIDKYRRKHPVPASDIMDDDDSLFANFPMPTNDDPETAYLRNMFWEQLQAALAELPAEQRDVFVWHELEGKTFNEIAGETGVPLKTLISRKGYAVKHLRLRLGDLYQDFVNF